MKKTESIDNEFSNLRDHGEIADNMEEFMRKELNKEKNYEINVSIITTLSNLYK